MARLADQAIDELCDRSPTARTPDAISTAAGELQLGDYNAGDGLHIVVRSRSPTRRTPEWSSASSYGSIPRRARSATSDPCSQKHRFFGRTLH